MNCFLSTVLLGLAYAVSSGRAVPAPVTSPEEPRLGEPLIMISNTLIRRHLNGLVVGDNQVISSGPQPYFHFTGQQGGGMCLDPGDSRYALEFMGRACGQQQCHTHTTAIRVLKKNFAGTLMEFTSQHVLGGTLRVSFSKSFKMRIHYKTQSSQAVQAETYYYGFPRNRWVQLNIVVCRDTLTVYVNCQRLFHTLLNGHIRCPVADVTSSVCVGKSVDQQSSPITMDVRDMALMAGDATEHLCPELHAISVIEHNMTQLKQTRESLIQEIEDTNSEMKFEMASRMEQTVEKEKCRTNSEMLHENVMARTRDIVIMTEQVDSVQEQLVSCTRDVANITCNVSGTLYAVGSSVPHQCQICECAAGGQVKCTEEPCTPIVPGTESRSCPYGRVVPKDVENGICCDTCQNVTGACRYRNKFYEHGSVFKNLDGGVCSPNCSCQNHKKVCPTEACEQLPCQPAQRYTPVGQCCPRCTEEENPCEANPSPCARHQGDAPWTCVNRGGRAECICYFIPSGGGCYTGLGRK
eukprot:scpid45854/ scgid23349/ 